MQEGHAGMQWSTQDCRMKRNTWTGERVRPCIPANTQKPSAAGRIIATAHPCVCCAAVHRVHSRMGMGTAIICIHVRPRVDGLA
eukprot:scaffold322208_cov28-Tisochrysis_lutea.AAC.1